MITEKPLTCPICGRVPPATAARFLPFCSDRCRLIDLGRWLDEQHSIPCSADEDDQAETDPANGSRPAGGAADQDVRPPIRLPPGWHDA